MAQPTIDPTFYRTAADAAAAPGEELAYVVAFDRAARKHDAMTVIDVDPASDSYGRVVGWTDIPASATSCTISAGTRAAARSSTRATTWTALPAATCWCPACAPRTSTCSTRARPAPADARQDDRRPDALREGRPLPSAHAALRPRRGLPHLPGRRRGRRRRPGRHRAARPRDVRRAARLGDRPRAAALPLRRLVAPQPERADLQRVGQPVDDRGRHRAGAPAGPEVRPRHPLLGPRRGQARAARRPGRRSTRWRSRCARPTTPRRRGASSAS